MAKQKKPAEEAKKIDDKKNRGTSDDLEVLAQIISENVGLKNRILEKIRHAKVEMDMRNKKNGKKNEK